MDILGTLQWGMNGKLSVILVVISMQYVVLVKRGLLLQLAPLPFLFLQWAKSSWVQDILDICNELNGTPTSINAYILNVYVFQKYIEDLAYLEPVIVGALLLLLLLFPLFWFGVK